MNKDWNRLLKNLVAIAIIALAFFLVYFYISNQNQNELEIDTTPIHIESIKTIAEISTVSYKDEVVMDTVERYDETHSIYDPREWIRMYDRDVKRRLTLIVKGEVKYGIDLTNKNYSIDSNKDTIWINLPSPKILDVIVSPSKTEVFQEQGEWSDQTRRKLESEAKYKLKDNAKKMNLHEKAEENTRRMLKKLIQTKKELILQFEDE